MIIKALGLFHLRHLSTMSAFPCLIVKIYLQRTSLFVCSERARVIEELMMQRKALAAKQLDTNTRLCQAVPAETRTRGKLYPFFLLPSRTLFWQASTISYPQIAKSYSAYSSSGSLRTKNLI